MFEDPNSQSLPQTFIMDINVTDNNHGIEIESLENIFHKYDIVSDLPGSLKSCFLVTSFTSAGTD